LLTTICFALIVVAGTAGELCVSRASKETGELHDFRPIAIARFIGRVLRNRWIWLGVGLMSLGFFSLLTVLSVENVSFVVPVTALGYVAGALGGRFFLKEKVSARRWIGVALVCAGVTLVVLGKS
jgi:drug/metabolite transporter (DMT)-like permease